MAASPSSGDARQKEIERKFLVTCVPVGIDDYQREEIKQGYLAVTAQGEEVRLRAIGNQHYETVKGAGGLTRSELEIRLTAEQFEALWPATVGRRIEKTRYLVPYGDHTIELDIFHGELEGLILAEVEFGDEEASQHFVIPEWFAQEVTIDRRYKNQRLALEGTPGNSTPGC